MRLTFALGISAVCLVVSTAAQAFPGTGNLYGIDAGTGDLVKVNPFNGNPMIVGNPGLGPTPSLAVHPVTGRIYAGGGGGSPLLYELSALDGSATLIGDTGLGGAAISALEFDANGVLYASVNIAGDGGTGADHLATIDYQNAVTTIIGPYGVCSGVIIPSQGGGSCSIDGMEALAFDLNGVLWGAVRTKAGAGPARTDMYTINTNTGEASFVRSLINQDGINSWAGNLVSMQFDCSGNLLGGTAPTSGGSADGGDLVAVNLVNGMVTPIGSTVPSGRALSALSYDATCPVPVEDSTWGKLKATYR